MKLAYLVAGAQIGFGVFVAVFLTAVLVLSDQTVPIWLAAATALAICLACYELARHARELVRHQKRLNQ